MIPNKLWYIQHYLDQTKLVHSFLFQVCSIYGNVYVSLLFVTRQKRAIRKISRQANPRGNDHVTHGPLASEPLAGGLEKFVDIQRGYSKALS